MRKFTLSQILHKKLQDMSLASEDILEGRPRARGEILFISKDEKFYLGIWECTRGRFLYKYDEVEICLILEGLAFVRANREKITLKKGDFIIFPKGLETIWEIKRKIKKIFFIYED